jgi:hypothetical protein
MTSNGSSYKPLGVEARGDAGMLRRGGLGAVIAAAAMLAAGMAEAVVPQDLSAVQSTPSSDNGIVPYIIPGVNPGGNRACGEVGKAYFGNQQYYLCHSPAKNFPFANVPELFEPAAGLPAECANTISVTTDGTFVDWTSTAPVGAAIIKGGNASNTYVYEPQDTSDGGLASPVNSSGNPAGLSNIGGFCWNPEAKPSECFDDETAWAKGTRYTPRGNWATYVGYTGAAKVVTLFAGQTINVGTVAFSAPAGGFVKITVTLTGDWEFAVNYKLDQDGNPTTDRDDNIKVQDYATAPSGNPAPGLFMWKTVADGQAGEINVPLNNYYGVHVDVAKPVDCPTD